MIVLELSIATIAAVTCGTLWLWTAWLDTRAHIRFVRMARLQRIVAPHR